MDWPAITFVATTYFPDTPEGQQRLSVVRETVRSWLVNTNYPGLKRIHIADDGSRYSTATLRFIADRPSTTMSKQNRHGVGASLNAGFKEAFKASPLVLYAVDDWQLTGEFFLSPWAKLLMERSDVGMVRLGPPHPNISGKVEVFTEDWQGWGLRLDRQGYAFAHRPALYHKRFIDAYGWFKEDVNALECERLYAENFAKMPGPDIVLALPHPWWHQPSIELADVEPGHG